MTRETLIMILDAVRVGCAASSRHLQIESRLAGEAKREEKRERGQLALLPTTSDAEPKKREGGNGRRDKVKGKVRRSRQSERFPGASESLYTSDGYARIAAQLKLGSVHRYTNEAGFLRWYVWLTEPERKRVKAVHTARRASSKARKEKAKARKEVAQ